MQKRTKTSPDWYIKSQVIVFGNNISSEKGRKTTELDAINAATTNI